MQKFLSAVVATLAIASSQAQWTIVAPNVGTIATGVAFVNNKTGYLPVAANGVGTEILRSRDGGYTWTAAKEEPFALLLLDVAAFGKNVAVVGALTLEYSVNEGVDFNASLVLDPGAGQCIRTIGPQDSEIGFAAVGQWGLFTESNGLEVSFDAGAFYTTVNISNMAASARYGAFPDDQTWFVAAGDWPGEGADDNPVDDNPPLARSNVFARHGDIVFPEHYINEVPAGSTLAKMQSSRIHLVVTPDNKPMWAYVKREARVAALTGQAGFGNATTWDAQIAKTSDGGKTWSIVFSRLTSQYYLNGIECSTTSQCCVVGETGDSSDPTGGTYIWCTTDGGNTWNETLIDNDPDSSLTDIGFVSDNEYWATGGEFDFLGISGPHFYHTVDGGITWNVANVSMANQYGIAMDCVPGDTCYVNLLDVLTQESSVAKYLN